MTIGPGKYDDLCTYVFKEARIVNGGAIVIVIGGNKGNGFSIIGDMPTMMTLPVMLETMATQIRNDMLTKTRNDT
jgi:hypothetical protein